jgi:hypothetical protein
LNSIDGIAIVIVIVLLVWRCCFRLCDFLPLFRFWTTYYTGPNLGSRSALKPNPTQAGVVFTHALV